MKAARRVEKRLSHSIYAHPLYLSCIVNPILFWAGAEFLFKRLGKRQLVRVPDGVGDLFDRKRCADQKVGGFVHAKAD